MSPAADDKENDSEADDDVLMKLLNRETTNSQP